MNYKHEGFVFIWDLKELIEKILYKLQEKNELKEETVNDCLATIEEWHEQVKKQ